MSQDRFQGTFLFVSEGNGSDPASAIRAIRKAVIAAGGTVVVETHERYAAAYSGEFRAIKRATRGKGALYQQGERRRLDDLGRKRPDLSELLLRFRDPRTNRTAVTNVG